MFGRIARKLRISLFHLPISVPTKATISTAAKVTLLASGPTLFWSSSKHSLNKKPELALSSEEKYLTDLLNEGNLFLKNTNSPYTTAEKLLLELKDPLCNTASSKPQHKILSYEPASTILYKYDYLTGEIQQSVKSDINFSEKSLSYLSPNLHTRLYDFSDCMNSVVALAFDRRQCEVLAMFTGEVVTAGQNISTDLKKLQEYKEDIETVSFKDFDNFRWHVDQHPNQLNEVLALLNKKGLCGIIIDSNINLRRAEEIKKFAKLHLDINLPIFYYNRRMQSLTPIKSEENTPRVTRLIR